MPVPVRAGLALLGASLLLGAVTMAGPGRSPIAALVVTLLFGALLFAVARRNNWARIACAVLVAVGVALNAMLLPLQLDQDRLVAASTVVQGALQIGGVLLLLRPASARWYGAPGARMSG
jgi:hypothetical protein